MQKIVQKTFISLQLKATDDFEENLADLISHIKMAPNGATILAPELVLNGYSYDRLDECDKISQKAIEELLKLSSNKIISLTMTIKNDDETYSNRLFVFFQNQIIHTQDKVQLFDLNDESKHFKRGSKDDIKIVEIDGLKYGFLICFELRFIDFWQELRGCDVIMIPAMWGLKRKANFRLLTQAIAVANQCFVIASDSANDDMAKSSAIISPFGDYYEDDNLEVLIKEIDLREIKKMRRYLNIGI
jgi:predicted amidohydrolase